jgi:predicted 3-demethylubiquinone-9 3-methyltransferase (glyoxalase superfamily)
MPSITPSLWFDNDLEEAAEFYTSVFPNSKIESMNRFNQPGPGTPGEVVSGSFVLDGTRFVGINVQVGYTGSLMVLGHFISHPASAAAVRRGINQNDR